MISLTTTYYKIKEIQEYYRIIQGGQAAGKNWAIEILLLEHALEKRRIITILTDTYENLKDSAIQDYKEIFNLAGLDFNEYYNKQDKELRWGESVIQFRYVADHKPQAGKSKRRNILYINEANKIGYESAKHYVDRTSEFIYIDYNPDREFWVHTDIEPREDARKIIVTYRDNEKCPIREVENIEARRGNEEWYRVYGLGLTGTYSDRRIYKFSLIDEIPATAKRIPSGMDFGVSPDPTVLVDCYVDGPTLYMNEVFSENNLLPEKITGAERPSIVDRLDQIGHAKNWLIIGDSSGATELGDMRRHGYNVRAVKKYAGSVSDGIQKLRSYNLVVTKKSVNLIKGLESWFWKVDKNGKIVPEPDGHEPDGLAAVRYVVMAKNYW